MCVLLQLSERVPDGGGCDTKTTGANGSVNMRNRQQVGVGSA